MSEWLSLDIKYQKGDWLLRFWLLLNLNSKSSLKIVFLITGCLSQRDVTWADQINRQYAEDFSGVAYPPCVERPQGTKWTAIKEDEWGIWISHPGPPHYMSNSFLNPHQHSGDFQCSFTTAQTRLQSPKRKKKSLFLLLHDAAVTYKLMKIKASLFIRFNKFMRQNLTLRWYLQKYGRGNAQFFLYFIGIIRVF